MPSWVVPLVFLGFSASLSNFGGAVGTAGNGNVAVAAAAGRSTTGRGDTGGGIGRGGPTVTRGGANGPVG